MAKKQEQQKGPHGGRMIADDGVPYELVTSRWSGWFKIYPYTGEIKLDGGYATHSTRWNAEWMALSDLEIRTREFVLERRTKIRKEMFEDRAKIELELGINLDDYDWVEREFTFRKKPQPEPDTLEPAEPDVPEVEGAPAVGFDLTSKNRT